MLTTTRACVSAWTKALFQNTVFKLSLKAARTLCKAGPSGVDHTVFLEAIEALLGLVDQLNEIIHGHASRGALRCPAKEWDYYLSDPASGPITPSSWQLAIPLIRGHADTVGENAGRIFDEAWRKEMALLGSPDESLRPNQLTTENDN
jgi:hypothetical protein